MAVTMGNVYRGPANKLELSSDGGTTWTDLGAIGNNNVEMNFEPVNYELGDRQNPKMYAMFKLKAEFAETHTSNLTALKTAETTPSRIRVTGLDGKIYTTVDMLMSTGVKRGFSGNEPHLGTIEAQLAVVNEDDALTIA